jgi:3-phenylpropionate/trans-cinnamate dioxygenase ferredoxin reductase subunit
VADTFVIVGAGLAGAKAAEGLRAEGFDGRLVLIGAEPDLPYERPPLSKSYLAGQTPFEEARVHDEGFYEERSIELMTSTVVDELRPGEHTVVLAGGQELRYDRLLLATGAQPRKPPIPGADRDGVLVLRTVRDSDAVRAAAQGGGRLAIIGAGWIGCEVAASARSLGAEVTLIEQVQRPLERVLGPELGDFFAEVHREEGVELRMGAAVKEIADGRVVLDSGEVAADAVLIATGVAPDTRLAEAAGLELDNGVVVDERLRTSAPDVYAAGDIARAPYARWGGRAMRVEHWANAIDQGTAAAKSMLDREFEEPLPYFFTDQYDVGMEYAGAHGDGDTLRIDGELERAGFEALWLDADGRVTAGMHINRWDAMDRIRGLVSDRVRL